jgi:hypothetical protein
MVQDMCQALELEVPEVPVVELLVVEVAVDVETLPQQLLLKVMMVVVHRQLQVDLLVQEAVAQVLWVVIQLLPILQDLAETV